jgi:hypothetical protein
VDFSFVYTDQGTVCVSKSYHSRRGNASTSKIILLHLNGGKARCFEMSSQACTGKVVFVWDENYLGYQSHRSCVPASKVSVLGPTFPPRIENSMLFSECGRGE